MTAFYMARSYYMTFTGEYRGNEVPLVDPYPQDTERATELLQPTPVRGPTAAQLEHAHIHDHQGHDAEAHDDHHGHHGGTPHESPSTMTIPLYILGGASLVLGAIVGFPPVINSMARSLLGKPQGWELVPTALEHWLHPVLEPGMAMMKTYSEFVPSNHFLHNHAVEYGLAGLSVVVASIGWFGARALYKDNKNPLPGRLLSAPEEIVGGLAGLVRGFHRLVYNKFFVDEVCFTVFLTGGKKFWEFLSNIDKYLVDGIVNGAAFLGKSFGFVQGAIDKYLVDGAVNLVAHGIAAGGARIRTLQTGQIRTYLLGAFGGAVAAFVLLVVFMGG